MIKFSLYDFDKTIYSKDTGVQILKKIAFKKPRFWISMPKIFLALISFKSIPKDKLKEIFFSSLSLFTKAEWEEFIIEFWEEEQANLFPDVLKQIQSDQENGYVVGIISASYEIFLRPIAKQLDVDFLIGTVVDESQDTISSKIIGTNCKNHEKVVRLQDFIGTYCVNHAYTISKMYSDSLNDLPLFEIAEQSFTVEKDGTIREGLPKPNRNI